MLGLGLSLAKASAAKAATPYQNWPGYPDSPVLTKDYPYQSVYTMGYKYLVLSTSPYYITTDPSCTSGASAVVYRTNSSTWAYVGTYPPGSNFFNTSEENFKANADIYTDSSLTTVAFHKNV